MGLALNRVVNDFALLCALMRRVQGKRSVERLVAKHVSLTLLLAGFATSVLTECVISPSAIINYFR